MSYVRLLIALAASWSLAASAQFPSYAVALDVAGDHAAARRVQRLMRRELRRLDGVVVRKSGVDYTLRVVLTPAADARADVDGVAVSFAALMGYVEVLSVEQVAFEDQIRQMCSSMIARFNSEVLEPDRTRALGEVDPLLRRRSR